MTTTEPTTPSAAYVRELNRPTTREFFCVTGRNQEPFRVYRAALSGQTVFADAGELDEWDDLCDAAPGFYAFEGKIHDVRGLTEDEAADLGLPMEGEYEEFYVGPLRAARADELVALGLCDPATPSPTPEAPADAR